MRFYYTVHARKKGIGIPRIIVPDFTKQFEIVGRLAKYFKGGLSIPDMMNMTFEDVFYWYKIHERQIAEQIISEERARGDKPPFLPHQMDKAIDKKIQQWYKELEA